MLVTVHAITITIRNWYDQLLGVFTDKEAWFLFRLSAFLETLGWSLLFTGILFSKFKLVGYEFVLPIAGSIHGIFFIAYVLIVFFAHRSMNWSVGKFVVAELVGNVPGGALIFELFLARARSANK